MAAFSVAALGYRMEAGEDGNAKLDPPDDAAPDVRPDLRQADGDVDAEVRRLIGLGASQVDVGQTG